MSAHFLGKYPLGVYELSVSKSFMLLFFFSLFCFHSAPFLGCELRDFFFGCGAGGGGDMHLILFRRVVCSDAVYMVRLWPFR